MPSRSPRTHRSVLQRTVSAVLSVIAWAGCGSGGYGNPASARIAPVGESTPPEYAALAIEGENVARALAALDGIARAAMRETGVPGMAVAVVHDGETVYERGFGVREVGRDEPVDAETVFQLASLSKSVGATVVARVVGEGIVCWDDAIVDYLPWFALSDPYVTAHVTIADMYAHRSGLPDHAGDRLEDLGYDRAEILRRLRLEPLAPFRATYAYTNFGLTAAAVAVAKAAGTSWEDLSEARLYEPLGMRSTSSRFADYEAARNRARTHIHMGGGRWQPGEVRDPQAQSPAGGVSSNVRDMARWMRLILADGVFDGTPLVDADALRQALTARMTSNPPATLSSRAGSYGYGMEIGVGPTGRVQFAHSGAFSLGAATTFVLVPAERLGIVVLTNGSPIGVPEAVAQSFLDIVETGEVQRDWLEEFRELFAAVLAEPSVLAGHEPPADPAPAPPAAALTGTYANEYYGPAEVVANGGQLWLVLGPRGQQYPLTHWDGPLFSYWPGGESTPWISAVTFALGPDGTATAMTVEILDGNGLGTFTR